VPEPNGTVVFLGAGASKAIGLPLTNEILPKALERMGPSPPNGLPLFKGSDTTKLATELQETLRALYPGLDLRGRHVDVPSITSVLSLLDHLILSESPAGHHFDTQRLVGGRRLLERAMMEVLLDVDLSPVMEQLRSVPDARAAHKYVLDARRRMKPGERQTLREFLRWLRRKRDEGPLTLITTNYDAAIETELFVELGLRRVPTAIDFGFDWREPYKGIMIPRPARPHLSLYKLHGSLNWLRCDLCGQVYVNPAEVIAYLSFRDEPEWSNTCGCGFFPLRHLIVAPSMVRDVRDPHLLNIWRCATEALRTARQWFIVGYSLPAEDLAIRALFLRASHARGLEAGTEPIAERARRPGPSVTIVQRGVAARPAYRALFPGCGYLAGGIRQMTGAPAGPRARRRRNGPRRRATSSR
jgi:NAD-dependent SIR2 family protein deacetylase